MRDLDPNLASHLETDATTLSHCWQLTRKDGVSLGFTNHDRDLAFDGTVFRAETGGTLSALSTTADLAVDNASLIGALESTAISEEDIAHGRYDGASIKLWLVNWQNVDQRLLLKSGTLGEVRRGPTAYEVEFRGLTHLLDQVAGRLYQHTCDATLGDANCTVDVTSSTYQATATIISRETDHSLALAGLETFAPGWFANGHFELTTGEGQGLSFHVKSHSRTGTTANLTSWARLPAAISPGDTLLVTAGCDKQFSTCREKFANGVNFRGFPHMPGNDFITAYPLSGEKNDGGKR